MARNIQIIKFGLVLFTITATVSGCGNKATVKSGYSYSDSQIFTAENSEDTRIPGFAENLCVVTDEDTFSKSDSSSEAAGLFDLNDHKVLYSKNAFEKLYPASITKVMTALIAMKYGNLSDQVTVTEDAVIKEAGATLCGIQPGDVISLKDLLYGLMIPSGNDAGSAIAVHIAGSIDAFSELMNKEAIRLGATQTHFVNPHGLHNTDHYTTAYDLYLIFNEALKYPLFKEIISAQSYTANFKNKNDEDISKTWNCSNWYIAGNKKAPDGVNVVGGKTGTTSAAGYCLIMASDDEHDKEYISVVLKSSSRAELYKNMTNIITKIVD